MIFYKFCRSDYECGGFLYVPKRPFEACERDMAASALGMFSLLRMLMRNITAVSQFRVVAWGINYASLTRYLPSVVSVPVSMPTPSRRVGRADSYIPLSLPPERSRH